MDNNYIVLPDSVIRTKKVKQVKPKQSADTLFNFMSEFDHLKKALENKMLSPRYCKENIRYLGIKNIKEIAFPMKCFCDINIHKLSEHVSWYGSYAIGFSKSFGVRNGIQPITYVNEESMYAKDYRMAFASALNDKDKKSNTYMKNFLFHQLMYVKPVKGQTYNRLKGRQQKKILTDEQEWRYIPSAAMLDVYNMKQAIIDKDELDESVLILESNSLDGKKECSITFEYEDIKYLMITDKDELPQFYSVIDDLDISKQEKYDLCTKLIVWNLWEEDL